MGELCDEVFHIVPQVPGDFFVRSDTDCPHTKALELTNVVRSDERRSLHVQYLFGGAGNFTSLAKMRTVVKYTRVAEKQTKTMSQHEREALPTCIAATRT